MIAYFKSLNKKGELTLVIAIVLLCVTIFILNSAFLSTATLFETLKSCVVPGIIGIGLGAVLINGGVDMSCMSIAIFSAYSATKILIALNYQGGILPLFLIAIVIGAVLGSFNALFISFFKIPIFIATLCTGVIFKGIMLEYIGNIYITPANMPKTAVDFSKATVFGDMHISVFILVGLMILSYFIFNRTMFGRGIYAMGGDPVSAARIGYNVKALNIGIYAFAGALYAIGGVVFVCNSRLADPYEMIGSELSVIAAVVLGGVSITSGKGSLMGIFLGTLFTVILKNNLVLIGVSSDWQMFVFGLIFILAIVLQAYREKRTRLKKIQL